MEQMPVTKTRPRPKTIITIHKWLGIGAAVFWLVQACTGILLSFHFELEDATLSINSPPTDFSAIEQRLDVIDIDAEQVNWIWTSAGLPDRYVINSTNADGVVHLTRIDGAGEILRDRRADDHSFLSLMREVHITLLAGRTGQVIMAITGIVLFTNIIFGIMAAWPRRQKWTRILSPSSRGNPVARMFSWHRAVGLWGAIPALLIVATGVMITFEHEIEHVIGVEEVNLPTLPLEAEAVGFAAAAKAATEAIPGSRFVGTTFPTASDASYQVWVRAPGELYRKGGYGGSLVIVNANDGRVQGAWPVTEASAAKAFVASFYPLHTGEAGGLAGRVLAMLTGVWLLATVIFGLTLWLRRRKLRRS